MAATDPPPRSPKRQGSDPGGRPSSADLRPSSTDLRRGRRIAVIGFLTLVGVWVISAGYQIIQQGLFPTVVPSPYPTCEAGLKNLGEALARARTSVAEGDDDPDEALRRFRTALDPEWRYLEGIRVSCSRAEDLRSLDALERLRYAEEHAVRRESASLAALRRKVDEARPNPASPRAPSSDVSKDSP